MHSLPTAQNLQTPVQWSKQQTQLARFVVEYLNALGASHHWDGDILVAELDEDQARVLTGLMAPAQTLKVAFHPELLTDPSIELICPGSFRLEQILDSIARRSKITCQFGYTEADRWGMAPVTFVPFLFMVLHLGYLSPSRQEENCIEVGCNLVTGQVIANPYRYLVSLYRSTLPPFPAQRYKRRISFLQAYRDCIGQYIVDLLKQEDRKWAEEASAHLQQESQEIAEYFTRLDFLNTTDDKAEERASEKELRLKEAQLRNQPRVVVRPLTSALLYLSESALALNSVPLSR